MEIKTVLKNITFVKNIEDVECDKDKDFHIFIGKIPGRFWYSIKIFKTDKNIRHSKNLINDNGDYYEGNYINREIYVYSIVKFPNNLLPKFRNYKIIDRILV